MARRNILRAAAISGVSFFGRTKIMLWNSPAKDFTGNGERILGQPAIERGEELRRNTRDEFQADPETHHENDEAPFPDGKESKD